MRATTIFALICMSIVAMTVLGVRVFGPGDLYEKDQPKTIAYTADIVLHGRYALPRDVIYQPATKPPMYNWIGAAVVKITGSWSEFALKFPSVLGVIATGAIVFLIARKIGGSRDGLLLAAVATAIWFTFGSDVRHGSVIRLSYLARPDMLLCAFMTGAWALATLAADREKSFWIAMAFWACVLGAALTKGPAALLPIFYAIALVLVRPATAQHAPVSRLKQLNRLWIPVGLPLVIVGVAAWLLCAYRQDPVHVRDTILWAEVGARVLENSPENISKPFYYTAMWFVTKTQPWGVAALIGLAIWLCNRKRDRAYFPAVLWVILALIFFSIPAGKRMDYLLPIYPAASVLAVYAALHVCRSVRLLSVAPILPVAVAALLAYSFLTKFHESRSHYTDRTAAFVREVRRVVGPDDLLVILRGKHPITTLLGRHQGSFLTPDDLAKTKWVILTEQADLRPVVQSDPVPMGFETIETRPEARIALYRTGDGGPSLSLLIAHQRAVGAWTNFENPYHAPGTVFQEVSH